MPYNAGTIFYPTFQKARALYNRDLIRSFANGSGYLYSVTVANAKLIVSDRKLPLKIESIGHLDKKPILTYVLALYNILKDIREFSSKRELELERNSQLCRGKGG